MGMAELGHAEGPIRDSARLRVPVLVMYQGHDVLQFAILYCRSEDPFGKVRKTEIEATIYMHSGYE
jgi:hypothetical protein